MSGAAPRPILVIGYGCPLRGDDAAGLRVAQAVAAWGRADVDARPVHQLVPELAEPLAKAELAVFVDARAAASADEPIDVQPIEADGAESILGHVAEPRALLAFTRAVFGAAPRAWLVTIPAVDFELREGLTPAAERGAREALRRIAELIGGSSS